MKRNAILVAVTFFIVFMMIGNSSFDYSGTTEEGLKVSSFLEEDTYANEPLINLLLLGLDRRSPEEDSRSDSMIILTIDKKNKSVKVASLMRDMYVPIPGKGENKINAAYTYGGGLLSIETVNRNFGLNIRDFVSADFVGFERLIDILGGVEIDIKPKEVEHCLVEKPGMQSLNGKQALAYSRLRKVGNADFERTERQRRVLKEIYKRLGSMNAKELSHLVKELLSCVETSLNLKEIVNLATEVSSYEIEGFEELRIPIPGGFSDEKINGAYCLVPDLEENRRVLKEFIYWKEDDKQ